MSSVFDCCALHRLSALGERFCANYIYDKFIKFATVLPHSRRLEEEADQVGLMLVAKVVGEYSDRIACKVDLF